MKLKGWLHHSARAFSLIEVTLSIGIVAFALIAILSVFPIGVSQDRSNIKDTRGAQIANAIMASIDSQCNAFTSVNCFGLTVNLSTLNNFAGAPLLLYASFPDPSQPVINTTKAGSIYTVELRFENNPGIVYDSSNNPTVTLGAGKLSRVQIRVLGQTNTVDSTNFFYIARKK